MIKVKYQSFISEKGRRDNNEDYCAYDPQYCYVVCDGVGGSEKGEIASEIVVKSFIESYKKNPDSSAAEVLRFAEDQLSAHINEQPETMGMATTLTFSQIKSDGIYLAWVGDSRIYQFRKDKIIFVTQDHSWVNEAVKAGILTPAEAINHPKSNVITRAVQGSHKPAIVDDILLQDIQKDDLFLHCSDGVLEAWEDDALAELFGTSNDPEKILQKIQEQCAISSRDNYTAIVYRIEESDLPKITEPIYFDAIPVDDVDEIPTKIDEAVKKEEKPFYLKTGFVLFLLLVIASLVVLLVFDPFESKDKNKITAKNVVKPNTASNNKTNIQENKSTVKSSLKNNDENKNQEQSTLIFSNNKEKIWVEIDLNDASNPNAYFYFEKNKTDKSKLEISKEEDSYELKGEIKGKVLKINFNTENELELTGKYDKNDIIFKKIED